MGIFQEIPPASVAPVQTRLPGAEADALEAALADMAANFASDFVSARVGELHNTYEHRSRVLRQMAGRLTSLRARDALAQS